jgi:hypothetical protein
MNFKIGKDTVNLIVDYLSKKPYIEVYQIIPLLLNLPSAEEVKDATTGPKLLNDNTTSPSTIS